MGGYGSGRTGGLPTVEDALTINLPLMMRRGWLPAGQASGQGQLTWSVGGIERAKIGFSYSTVDTESGTLTLSYTRTPAGKPAEKVVQSIQLATTQPHHGGRRWWMVCPYSGKRATKLYMPPGGDRFAGRAAWRLGYRSQRVAHRDRPFEKVFRLQRKLGSYEGWEAGLIRPKGMWTRTYERHWERYLELDADCSREMVGVMALLEGKHASPR